MTASDAAALEITRTFRAPRPRVFAAWTEPETLKRWYRLDETWEVTVAEVDLRVGGRYRIGLKPPGREAFFETGEFREVVAPELLVYTNEMSGAGEHADHPPIVVTVTFAKAQGGPTRVTVREEGYPSEQARDVHVPGWPRFLDNLDSVVDPSH